MDTWKVERVLSGGAARAEALRQQVAVEDLLGTTLPAPLRVIMKEFHSQLNVELYGERHEQCRGYSQSHRAVA